MAKRGAKKRRKSEDDPVSRLAFVLLRYFRGWWDKVKLVKAGGFLSSQVTMWDHGDRPVPWPALLRTADVTGFPRYLLGAVLRVLRSFLLATWGRSRPRRALAEVSVVELFPLAVSALDLILEPLDEPPVEEAQEAADALLERLRKRTERQRWLLVESVPEFRQGALVPKLVEESLRLAPNHPRESLEWAKQAVRLSELVGSGGSHAWAAVTNRHTSTNERGNFYAHGAPGSLQPCRTWNGSGTGHLPRGGEYDGTDPEWKRSWTEQAAGMAVDP